MRELELVKGENVSLERILSAGVAAVLIVMGAAASIAAPLDITGISGVWQNEVGGTNVVGLGTPVITWGSGIPANDSGYSFRPGPDIIAASVATPLFLGTFTHTNNPIPIPNLTGVDLSLGFNTNGLPALVGAIFPFAHNETPNTCGCSPTDDDIVTITTPIVNIPITVGTDTFFFNLLGFSIDGGITFANVFSSPEGGSNSANLYGRITTNPVPEPASLLLLGGGIVGLAARRSGRKQG